MGKVEACTCHKFDILFEIAIAHKSTTRVLPQSGGGEVGYRPARGEVHQP